MELIDEDRASHIYGRMPAGLETFRRVGRPTPISGRRQASAAGAPSAARFAKDQLGEVFIHDIQKPGHWLWLLAFWSAAPRDRTLSDRGHPRTVQRTMATYLGSARPCFSPDDVRPPI